MTTSTENTATADFFSREMTRLEELQSMYSDLYKDVYGIRPRGCSDECWNDEEWLSKELDFLSEQLKEVLAGEAAQEAVAIEQFEAKVLEVIATGAADRETAVRWLMDAEDVGGDDEYFCFLNGLPYGYFRKAV